MEVHDEVDPTEVEEAQANAVNRAILASIERLNNNMVRMNEFMFNGDQNDENTDHEGSYVDEEETIIDDTSIVSIQHDLDRIAGSNAAQTNSGDGEVGDILANYSSQLDLDMEQKAPKVNEEIAAVAEKLRLHRVSPDQCKALIKRHCTPENVKVRLPKCENSIWTQLPTRSRANDAKLQATQQILLAAINCLLEVTSKLANTKAPKDMVTPALDGLTLAMTANFELNLRRRDAIRPYFKPEFAKALCGSTNPADEYLFGGDTAKRVKEIAELQKSKICKGSSTSRGRNRFTPYWRGSRRGRGKQGGRNYTYQQADNNKKQSKTTNNWYVDSSNFLDMVNAQPPFVAGRTRQCVSEWVKLTTDPEILDIIMHCHIEFIEDPCLFSMHGQRNFDSHQTSIINDEVLKLVDLGVISPASHEQGECLSPIFVTPKRDGSFRLIFNFKNCNQAVQFRHFKMDTLNSVINIISPQAYFASLDLKHAYYTIPIAIEQRKYLKFLWSGILYEFNALPMGLTSSPRLFTKVMKPPLAYLRQKGCTISGYIDDFFIQGNDMQDCYSNLEETVRLFLRLGFYVHPEKSVFTPSQSLTFLGFNLNSVSMTVTLTQEKKEQLISLCTEALTGKIFPIRFVAKVIGKIVSALPGVEFGKLHYRNLERDKIRALSANNGDYNAIMQLSEGAKKELNWWCSNVMHVSRRIKHPPHSYSFQTDASDSGWGIASSTDESLQSHGIWSQEQRSLHINVRELYVVFICLTIFCKDMHGIHVRFELDNTTAVSYVNEMGGCKSVACNAVAIKIWNWCIDRDLWISAVYLPGTMNVEADALSRRRYSDHEWMLNKSIFCKLCKIFPDLTIDLFASVLNHQLPRYASWRPDPKAVFADAFSKSWEGEKFYAFPPFSLIPRCLDKVISDRAEGLIVVPAWPTQTWYTRILQMLISQPVVMVWSKDTHLLVHPAGPKTHSMQGRLKLMACLVSGNTTKCRAFHNTLPMYSSAHGDQPLRSSTQFILKNGLNSVVQGKLLHFLQI